MCALATVQSCKKHKIRPSDVLNIAATCSHVKYFGITKHLLLFHSHKAAHNSHNSLKVQYHKSK